MAQLSAPTLAEHEGTDEDEAWLEYSSIDANADTLILERAPNDGGSPGTWAQIDSIASPADPDQYRDTGRTAATIYWYRAKVQGSGFTDSAYSTAISVQVPYAPPTSLDAMVLSGTGPYSIEVALSGENASAGHEVWRADDGDEGSLANFNKVGTLEAGEPDFVDSAPAEDVWYQVRATGPDGATSSFTDAVQVDARALKLIDGGLVGARLTNGGLVA